MEIKLYIASCNVLPSYIDYKERNKPIKITRQNKTWREWEETNLTNPRGATQYMLKLLYLDLINNAIYNIPKDRIPYNCNAGAIAGGQVNTKTKFMI